jgi:hypothetical protein
MMGDQDAAPKAVLRGDDATHQAPTSAVAGSDQPVLPETQRVRAAALLPRLRQLDAAAIAAVGALLAEPTDGSIPESTLYALARAQVACASARAVLDAGAGMT